MNETRASVEHFDLNRHAVVEASAGTGKTYTIEQLVLRLLTEEAVPFERILIVTFTEKATGELKIRLRAMLERAIQKDDDFAPLLKPALDHFDQAPIFTIHGFCQRLLQEYALEQAQDFRAELVNDIDLLQTSLREIQRKHWRTSFGDRLRAVLDKALYNRETADDWDRKVLEIASKYKPRCGHQLRPAYAPDWYERLDEVNANWAGQLEIFTIDTLHQHLREFKRQRGLQTQRIQMAGVVRDHDKRPVGGQVLPAANRQAVVRAQPGTNQHSSDQAQAVDGHVRLAWEMPQAFDQRLLEIACRFIVPRVHCILRRCSLRSIQIVKKPDDVKE